MPEDLWPSPGYYADPDERSGLTYWDGYKWHLDMRRHRTWREWVRAQEWVRTWPPWLRYF